MSFKKFLARIILFTLCLNVHEVKSNILHTQSTIADSLLALYINTSDDFAKVDLLNELCIVARMINGDSSLFYGRKGLELAEEIGYIKGKCKNLIDLGTTYILTKNDVSKALESYIEAVQISENHEIAEIQGLALNLIGMVYLEYLDDADKALEYGMEAWEILKETNNQKLICGNLNNIGYTYSKIGRYQESLFYFFKSIDYNSDSDSGLSTTFNNIADVYLHLFDYNSVISYSDKSIHIAKRNHDFYNLSLAQKTLSEAYLKLSKYDSALKYGMLSYRYADSLGYKKNELESVINLKNIYSVIDEFDKAFYYSNLAYQLSSDINSDEKLKEVNRLLLREKEVENKVLIKERAFQDTLIRNQKIGIFFTSLVVVIVFILGYRLRKANQNIVGVNLSLENEVKNRTIELKESNRELVTFFYNSSHALKSPLVTVFGLVNLTHINSDENIQEVVNRIPPCLNNMMQTLKKLELMHAVMSNNGSLENISDVSVFLEEVINNHSEVANQLFISIEFNSTIKTQITVNKELIRIVLYLLIENSIIFRNMYIENKNINIELSDCRGGYMFSVIDNGIGVDVNDNKLFDMFYRGSEASTGTGLGLYIAKKATKKMNGSLFIDKNSKDKTRVNLFIPKS